MIVVNRRDLRSSHVECALKACIAKETKRYDFPAKRKVNDSQTNDLKVLIRLANLEVARSEEAEDDAAFRNNWDIVQQWSEHSRYQRHVLSEAKVLLDAASPRLDRAEPAKAYGLVHDTLYTGIAQNV